LVGLFAIAAVFSFFMNPFQDAGILGVALVGFAIGVALSRIGVKVAKGSQA
jgi:hypothetical protein